MEALNLNRIKAVAAAGSILVFSGCGVSKTESSNVMEPLAPDNTTQPLVETSIESTTTLNTVLATTTINSIPPSTTLPAETSTTVALTNPEVAPTEMPELGIKFHFKKLDQHFSCYPVLVEVMESDYATGLTGLIARKSHQPLEGFGTAALKFALEYPDIFPGLELELDLSKVSEVTVPYCELE
jgi:hypothetical protein